MVAYRIIGEGIIYQEMDDEIVIINLETGTYYQLNAAAAWLWKAIEAYCPADQMQSWFLVRYQGDPEETAASIQTLLQQLQNELLIGLGEVDENWILPESSPPTDRLPYRNPVMNKFTDMQDLLLLDPIHEVDESGWPHKGL